MTAAQPVVVVTGASRGLGRAVALRCGASRWRVAVHCRTRLADAESAALAVTDSGGEGFACSADLRDPDAIATMARRVIERWGRIDAWINNAAVVDDRLLVHMPRPAWDGVLAVNLSAVRHALHVVAPVMIAQRGGVILNVASSAALQGRAGQANYAASKAGLIGLTRSAARELAAYGIRVNAVCPPVLETDMTKASTARLRVQQLLPATANLEQTAEALLGVLALPGITGHTFVLDHRIANGAL